MSDHQDFTCDRRKPLAEYDYDVAVIGSGSGGLSAAIAAARNGARVMLIDRHGYLGGTMTCGMPFLGYLVSDYRPYCHSYASAAVNV